MQCLITKPCSASCSALLSHGSNYSIIIHNLSFSLQTDSPFLSDAPPSSGTELELQWGRNLQAALVHKLRENGSSDVGTEATLTYRINSVLRLQLQLAQGLTKPSILLQYSSDGMMSQ